MIGDLFNNNKRRDVCTRLDQVMRFGKKWKQEKNTGYYVCTTTDEMGNRRRLHDVLWEHENIDGIKKLPEGCVVHHIDCSGQTDEPNNDVDNLTTLCRRCHINLHKLIDKQNK